MVCSLPFHTSSIENGLSERFGWHLILPIVAFVSFLLIFLKMQCVRLGSQNQHWLEHFSRYLVPIGTSFLRNVHLLMAEFDVRVVLVRSYPEEHA